MTKSYTEQFRDKLSSKTGVILERFDKSHFGEYFYAKSNGRDTGRESARLEKNLTKWLHNEAEHISNGTYSAPNDISHEDRLGWIKEHSLHLNKLIEKIEKEEIPFSNILDGIYNEQIIDIAKSKSQGGIEPYSMTPFSRN